MANIAFSLLISGDLKKKISKCAGRGCRLAFFASLLWKTLRVIMFYIFDKPQIPFDAVHVFCHDNWKSCHLHAVSQISTPVEHIDIVPLFIHFLSKIYVSSSREISSYDVFFFLFSDGYSPRFSSSSRLHPFHRRVPLSRQNPSLPFLFSRFRAQL